MVRPKSLVIVVSSFALLGSVVCAQENERRPPADPYQMFFRLPGIEFSAEQQAKVDEIQKEVDEIQKEFAPKLADNQQRWNQVITDEQQQARREAFQKARDAGKQGQALRDAVNDALKLTDKQREQRAAIQKERDELLVTIRERLASLLTEEQQARVRRRPPRAQQQIPPTHANVKYGPHARNVMDVWLAESDKPTPVLVSIHGGGFLGGDKSVSAGLLQQCLDAGISVAAITYRFSSDAIAPASFVDSARAVQTIRHRAKEWNLDPERIAATGGSAGAGISLWLGFHDDLADPDNDDPVLRESTRLTCMMVTAGQTSYDPRFIRKLFPDSDTYKHGALARLFDIDMSKLDELPEEKYRLFEECSPLPHLTKDDAPALLNYAGPIDQEVTNANIGIHHAKFGKALKEKMDALGIPCEVQAGGQVLGGGERTAPIDFLKREFKLAE
ncbi:MAG: alpha/beta hydrolase fold domain-containing protein [Pirellulaceae bacterium]